MCQSPQLPAQGNVPGSASAAPLVTASFVVPHAPSPSPFRPPPTPSYTWYNQVATNISMPAANAHQQRGSTSNSIPPPQPPSVEESYRKKCIDLKRRMQEVDEVNDGYRKRAVRLKRGIAKLRLERAFLLEQLAKRMPEHVEDSDGTPDPPPTPKEKPVRSKKGGKRADVDDSRDSPASAALDASTLGNSYNGDGASDIKGKGKGIMANSPPALGSLSIPAIKRASRSRTRASPSMNIKYQDVIAHGIALPSRPPNPYVLFSNEKRPEMRRLHEGEGDFAVTKALAQAWQDLSPAEKEPWTGEAKRRNAEWKALVNQKTAELQASKLAKSRAVEDDDDEEVVVVDKGKGKTKVFDDKVAWTMKKMKREDEKTNWTTTKKMTIGEQQPVKEATPAEHGDGGDGGGGDDGEIEDADATEGDGEAEGEAEGEGEDDIEEEQEQEQEQDQDQEDIGEDSKMDET